LAEFLFSLIAVVLLAIVEKKKPYALVLMAVICVGYGMVVGEQMVDGTMSGAPLFFFPIALLLSLILFPIGWFLSKPKILYRVLGALLLPSLAALGWIGGAADHSKAYQDCLKNGERLRGVLAVYHKAHGEYPGTLTQLGWDHLPGNRLIGKNILHYYGTRDHYHLYFGDSLTTVTATESEPFEQLFS